MKYSKIIIEAIGWYGVMAVTIAYILLTLGEFIATSALYQILNLTGAIGIAMAAYMKSDHQSTTVNLIWAAIAVFGIVQIYFK